MEDLYALTRDQREAARRANEDDGPPGPLERERRQRRADFDRCFLHTPAQRAAWNDYWRDRYARIAEEAVPHMQSAGLAALAADGWRYAVGGSPNPSPYFGVLHLHVDEYLCVLTNDRGEGWRGRVLRTRLGYTGVWDTNTQPTDPDTAARHVATLLQRLQRGESVPCSY